MFFWLTQAVILYDAQQRSTYDWRPSLAASKSAIVRRRNTPWSGRSARGVMYCRGYAQEARHVEVWSRGRAGGLILERVKEERLDAPSLCLTRAWEEALSHLEALLQVQPSSNGKDGAPLESNRHYFHINAVKLNALSFAGGDSSREGQAYQSTLPFLFAPRVSR